MSSSDTTLVRRSTRSKKQTATYNATPTRPSSTLEIKAEHMELNGGVQQKHVVTKIENGDHAQDTEQIEVKSAKRPSKKRRVAVKQEPLAQFAGTSLDTKPTGTTDTTPTFDSKVVKDESESTMTTTTEPKRSRKTTTKNKTELEDQEIFPPRVTTGTHFLGAHISSAGGVENSPLNALRIGSNAFSCFVRPKMQWASKPIAPESISKFRSRVQLHNYTGFIVPHGCYLVNLANPDFDKREKSYVAFLDDVQWCQDLGCTLFNFHPGSITSSGELSKVEGCQLVADYINRVHADTRDVTILVENMAGQGQGNILGGDLRELRSIIDRVHDKSRVGVCIDTCHAFAAGYDMRDRSSYERFVTQLDQDIGLGYVKAMHLNDSKAGLGEFKDRHENIGAGQLGIFPFYAILNDPRFANIPLILETPGGDDTVMHEVWKREIAALYSLQGKSKNRSEWTEALALLEEVQTIRNASKIKAEEKKAVKKSKVVANSKKNVQNTNGEAKTMAKTNAETKKSKIKKQRKKDEDTDSDESSSALSSEEE